MLTDYSVQDWPLDYNYQDEQHRFGNVGRLWNQAAEPGSEKWNASSTASSNSASGSTPP